MKYRCTCKARFQTRTELLDHMEYFAEHPEKSRYAHEAVKMPRKAKPNTRFMPEVEDYTMPETPVQRIRREVQERRMVAEQSRSGPVEIEEEPNNLE